MRNITEAIIHHSVTPRDLLKSKTIASFNRTHKARLHPEKNGLGYYIAYHYLVFADGEIIQTRPVEEIGYHAGDWQVNKESIGLCVIGDFDNEYPTELQKEALYRLCQQLKGKYKLKAIRGHRHIVSYKTCPGKNIPDEFIYTLINNKETMDEFKTYKEYLLENAKCNNKNWDKAFTKQEYAKMEYNLNQPKTIKQELIEHGTSMLVNLIGAAAITAAFHYGASMTIQASIVTAVSSVFVLQSGSKATLDSLVNKGLSYFKSKKV